MTPHERLPEILAGVPEADRPEAAARFLRYLEIVMAIADEEEARASGQQADLTDLNEPPTLSYSV